MRPPLHAMLALALLLGSYVVAAGVLLAPFVGAVLVARTGPYGWLVGGILVALAGIGIWRVVVLVRRRVVRPAPGIALTRASQGPLWAEVDEVAHELGVRTPDELRIVPDVGVTLSYEALRRWPRRLCLGMPLLTSLTALQLRAVIAQELGLYSGRTGLLGRVTYRGGEALRAVAADVGADSVAGRIVRRQHRLYTSIAHSVIRRHELEADRHSARLAGRAAAAAALREVAATDHAWDYFLDRYADLGAAQDLRPLAIFDGFQQFLAEPARQLQLVDVRAARADEVRSDQHSRRALSARIAALEALPPDEVIDDYTPAMSLVERPERAISDLEAWMYEGSRLVPASWDEIAAAAGAESVRAGAGLLTTAAEESGVAEPATLAAVFDAIRRGETAEMVRPLLEAGGPDAEWRRLAERLLTHLVVIALIDAGRASYRLSWTGQSPLVGVDGTPLDPASLVAHAIDDPTSAYALQGWLTACGVKPDYRMDITTTTGTVAADAGERRVEGGVGTSGR
ncbi:MAG TPA: M48 family metallopeptidase [Kribbellaceae bacterium]|nr:M48 family metallopeptidase [Kribbellaceae bacterium]